MEHVARMGGGEVPTGFWWVKPEGNIPLGRPWRRCGIILRWIFMTWMESMDWMDLGQNRDE